MTGRIFLAATLLVLPLLARAAGRGAEESPPVTPPLLSLPGHGAALMCIAVSGDGKRAVTGSEDLTVRVWDLVAGRELQCFRGHMKAIHTVAISPDGRLVASGSTDATAKVWDVQSGELIADFDSHPQMVKVVAFHPDGKRVWTGCCDHLLRLWDIETEEVVAKFEHRDCIERIDTLADGSRVVTGLNDGTVALWDTRTGKQLLDIASPDRGGEPKPHGYRDTVSFVGLREEGKQVLVASYRHGFRTFDGRSGKLVEQHVEKASFLMEVSKDGTLAVYNESRGPVVKTHPGGQLVVKVRTRGAVRDAAFSPDGKRLILACTSFAIPARDRSEYAVEVYDLQKVGSR